MCMDVWGEFLARQLDRSGFKSGFLQNHSKKLPSELFSAEQSISTTTFRDPGTLARINAAFHLNGSLNLELAMTTRSSWQHYTCQKSKVEMYIVVSISYRHLINITQCDSLGVKAQKQQVDLFHIGFGTGGFREACDFPHPKFQLQGGIYDIVISENPTSPTRMKHAMCCDRNRKLPQDCKPWQLQCRCCNVSCFYKSTQRFLIKRRPSLGFAECHGVILRVKCHTSHQKEASRCYQHAQLRRRFVRFEILGWKIRPKASLFQTFSPGCFQDGYVK